MTGWVADLFRLAWGLLYWNARKTWFRMGGARAVPPCQNMSDTGKAMETHCEACIGWNRPERFRRVCPLLVQRGGGFRCAADAPNVRPFWGPAVRFYGGAILTLYVAGVLAVFFFLRTVGYPVSIVHVALPPLWSKVGQARGWFFVERSNRAFAQGDATAGLLYLANAYDFDPGNYEAGLTLAKHYQAGQPALANDVFQRLLRDHPDRHDATAQDWYRALIAHGDFDRILRLAQREVERGGRFANAWMRALLFATEQTRNDAPLRQLLQSVENNVAPWRPLLEAELLVRSGRIREARTAIERSWPSAPPYALFRRVELLIGLGDPAAALDLLAQQPGVLDPDAETTLRLEAYAQAGAARLRQALFDAVLAPRVDPPRLVILFAHLIRHPDTALFERACERFEREPLPLTNDTAGAWFSLLCTAGVVGDQRRFREFAQQLQSGAKTPFAGLAQFEEFFRGPAAERRITAFLPMLPLPLEITYALFQRYSAPPPADKNA